MPVAIAAMLWLFTLVNCLGVREAGRVQVLTTVLKLVPLVGAILVGALAHGAGGADAASPTIPFRSRAASIQTAAATWPCSRC